MECSLDKRLQGFQLIAQEKLQAIICSIPGKKDLILEQSVIKPLEQICSASWIKLKGIQRIYKLDVAVPRLADQVQVYVIRSHLDTFQRVLKLIHEHETKQPTDIDAAIKNFHIICIPSCFVYFQKQLELEGLYGLVQLHRYNWDFIYLDQGVLSLEVPNVFATVFLRGDTSLLGSIAHSLRVLQAICGLPDLILTIGDHAATIVRMLNTLGPLQKLNNSATDNADFPVILIIDRDKDYASSLLTPAIYAGLLLEVFDQHAGVIDIQVQTNKILRQKLPVLLPPKHQVKEAPKQAKSQKPANKPSHIRLNSASDEIYGENRYKHFAQASSLVRAQAKAIGLEVHKLSDMKLDEMHDYVARKLPKITELKTKVMRHLNASEKVIEMLAENFRKLQSLEEDILNNVSHKRVLSEIDELLTTDGQQYNTLRLMCLLHLCGGVSPEELTHFVRNYCNYFGAKYLPIFQAMFKGGLLPALLEEEKLNKSAKQILANFSIPKFQQTEFQANANRLKLLVSAAGAEDTVSGSNLSHDNTSVMAGACPSYVFNSLYIPLTAQLGSFLFKSTSTEDFAAKLGAVDKIAFQCSSSPGDVYTAKSYVQAVKQAQLKEIFPLRRRSLFVFVVGGVTYAEIGACDLVARLNGGQIVCASDEILSGADLIASAF